MCSGTKGAGFLYDPRTEISMTSVGLRVFHVFRRRTRSEGDAVRLEHCCATATCRADSLRQRRLLFGLTQRTMTDVDDALVFACNLERDPSRKRSSKMLRLLARPTLSSS